MLAWGQTLPQLWISLASEVCAGSVNLSTFKSRIPSRLMQRASLPEEALNVGLLQSQKMIAWPLGGSLQRKAAHVAFRDMI